MHHTTASRSDLPLRYGVHMLRLRDQIVGSVKVTMRKTHFRSCLKLREEPPSSNSDGPWLDVQKPTQLRLNLFKDPCILQFTRWRV